MALIRSVVAQNAAALKHTESMYVEFTWENKGTYEPMQHPQGSLPGGVMTTEGHTRIWRRGDLYHQDLDLKHVWAATGETRDPSCIVVLNDRYLARYFKATRQLHVYRFENRQSLYSPVDTIAAQFPHPDILEFGFGAGSETLEDCFTQQTGYDPQRFRWTISAREAEGGTQYVIRSDHIRGNKPGLWHELVVDSTRGYLVTEYRHFNKQGEVRWESFTKPGQDSESRWFPKTATHEALENNRTYKYTVNEVRLSEAIPDTQFQLEAMDFEPGKVMMKEYTNAGRKVTARGYWGSQWVPLDLLPAERRSALLESQREARENR